MIRVESSEDGDALNYFTLSFGCDSEEDALRACEAIAEGERRGA